MGFCCSCCDQGGCCSLTPPRIIDSPDGTVRLNLVFYLQGCCESSDPLSKEDMLKIPEILSEKGLSQSVWIEWVEKLKKINKLRSGCCAEFCCSFSSLFLICIPCLLISACKQDKIFIMNWNQQLVDWQNDFNKQELEKLGLLVKTQSRMFVTRDENGKKKSYERWLAFALNESEVIKLENEPHLFSNDYADDCSCMGGVNQNECCVHPYNY
jgi:hypothetical protein